MTATDMQDYARAAYEAMREGIHGLSVISGKPLPTWEELDASVKAAWVAAIQATEDAVSPEPPPP